MVTLNWGFLDPHQKQLKEPLRTGYLHKGELAEAVDYTNLILVWFLTVICTKLEWIFSDTAPLDGWLSDKLGWLKKTENKNEIICISSHSSWMFSTFVGMPWSRLQHPWSVDVFWVTQVLCALDSTVHTPLSSWENPTGNGPLQYLSRTPQPLNRWIKCTSCIQWWRNPYPPSISYSTWGSINLLL